MILRHLLEFSERLDVPPPGYQRALITKTIRLNGDGSLKDVVPESGDKKGKSSKQEGKFRLVPREQPGRTVGVVPRLVSDNACYVLGVQREKDKPEQAIARHEAYVRLIEECQVATSEPSLAAIHKWLKSGGPSALGVDPATSEADEFGFLVDGVDPTELSSVRKFWAQKQASETFGTCLITGKHGPIVDRMPIPIKGVPDGQMSGTALVSVNNSAGMSYGLEAALNSPISAYAAEMISNGLNHLLASPEHCLKVGKVAYVYWTRGEDTFSWDFLSDPRPEHVGELISAPLKGSKGDEIEAKDFFVLTMSANASRIVVRDYHELTIDEAKRRIREWYRKLDLVAKNGSPGSPFGIFQLAVSLFREAKDIPAHVPTTLLHCALAGTPIPDSILQLAVKRNLAMQGPYHEFKQRRDVSLPRLSLIKAILEQKEQTPMSALNPNHHDPAYHCGRLLAVLEKVQKAAIPGLNATLVDRYYGAACASPGTILGNLVNEAQSHLAKLRKGSGDGWAQATIGDILSAVGDDFPKTLSLQRQGLFALGFYHQKAHDRGAAISANAAKQADQGDTE